MDEVLKATANLYRAVADATAESPSGMEDLMTLLEAETFGGDISEMSGLVQTVMERTIDLIDSVRREVRKE